MSEQQAPYGKPNKLAPLSEALVALEMAEDKLFKLSRAYSFARTDIFRMYERTGNDTAYLWRLLEKEEAAAFEVLTKSA